MSETPPLDWGSVPQGQVWEWKHSNPTAHTHIVCNVEPGVDEVYFRSVEDGKWSYGGPNAESMSSHLAVSDNWRRVERP